MKQPIRCAALVAAVIPAFMGSAQADQNQAQNAFNPKISVIFDGVFYQDSEDGTGLELLEEAPGIGGHGHGHEEGHSHGLDEGFNLREQEMAISATIDPNFDGDIYIAFTEEEVNLEEAYITTRRLPAGWKIKGGKFLSGIGYHNSKHTHSWNFADQNLAYLGVLGDHGLQDTGVQITWLPQLPFYTQLGLEWLQGEELERFGTLVESEEEREELGLAEADTGPQLVTGFIKVSPDLGFDHALQVGAWFATAGQDQMILEHEHDGEEEELGLEGDASLWGLEAVYKFDSTGAYGTGDIQVQAEYLSLEKDWTVRNGDEAGEGVSAEQDGFYIEALYGFAPRWQAGYRYDVSGMTNEIVLPEETEEFDDTSRSSVVVTWRPSEFSTIRAQYSNAKVADMGGDVNQFMLQFNYSLGAHGAHQF